MAIRLATTAAMLVLVPGHFLTARERTAEEFRDYAARRIANVEDEQLTAFVNSVDADGDGTITDTEFANRIEAFQRIFRTVHPVPGGSGHTLPDNWLTDFDEARAISTETGRPVLAMFSASWCGPCKMMIANVYPTEEAKRALEAFVPVYIDSEQQRDLAAQNDIRAFPTFVCFDTQGEAIDEHVGGGSVEDFVAMLATFRESANEPEDPPAE